MLAKRILSAENRINRLLEIIWVNELAPESHLKQLQMELYRYTNDLNFKEQNQ
jgi:hypothetical protein